MAWTIAKANLSSQRIADLFGVPLAEICHRINELEKFAGRGDPDDSFSPWNDANDAATAAGYSGDLPDFESLTRWRVGQGTSEQTFPIAIDFDGLAININGCLNLERAQETITEMLRGPQRSGASWVQGSYEFPHGVAHRQHQTVTEDLSPTDKQHRWDTRFTSHFMKPSDSDASWFLADVLTAASEGTAWKVVHGWPLYVIHEVFEQLYGALEQLTKIRYKCIQGTPNYRWLSIDYPIVPVVGHIERLNNNDHLEGEQERNWDVTWKGADNDVDVYIDQAWCFDIDAGDDAWEQAVTVGDQSTIDTPTIHDWNICDITRAWVQEDIDREHPSATFEPTPQFQHYLTTRFGSESRTLGGYGQSRATWGFRWGDGSDPTICTKFTAGTLTKVQLCALIQVRDFDPQAVSEEIEFSLDGGDTYLQAVTKYTGPIRSTPNAPASGKPDYEFPRNNNQNVARTIQRLDLGTSSGKVTLGQHTTGEDWSMETDELDASEHIETGSDTAAYSILAALNDETVEPIWEVLPNTNDWYGENFTDDKSYRGRGVWAESTLGFTYGP